MFWLHLSNPVEVSHPQVRQVRWAAWAGAPLLEGWERRMKAGAAPRPGQTARPWAGALGLPSSQGKPRKEQGRAQNPRREEVSPAWGPAVPSPVSFPAGLVTQSWTPLSTSSGCRSTVGFSGWRPVTSWSHQKSLHAATELPGAHMFLSSTFQAQPPLFKLLALLTLSVW